MNSEFLNSYKLVTKPNIVSTEFLQSPLSKYYKMLSFILNRNTASQESPETPETSIEFKWDAYNPLTSSNVQHSGNFKYTDNASWLSALELAYRSKGLSDNAIRNLIAKNSLESNWGKSQMSRFNNFGNLTAGKNWTGNTYEGNDHDGKGNKIKLKFRTYNSINDFVNDEINFLTRLYDFNPNDDFETFIGKLNGNNKAKRRYAESNNYASAVRNRYNLIYGKGNG